VSTLHHKAEISCFVDRNRNETASLADVLPGGVPLGWFCVMVDITKIGAFVQSSPYPAWLATDKGDCVYANPALERLTGFNSDQINRADWLSFLLEEDRAVASASWQRSLAAGTPYRVQVRMRGSDGAPKSVELIAFGHQAGDGTELWLFTGLDVPGVTAQKRSELEVQLQTTLNVIPAYTWYAVPSGALTFVNKRNANYLGLPKDHPLRFGMETGAEWDSHIPLLHPDDRDQSRRVWSACLSEGSAGEFSFRVRSAEGNYRWFLSRAEPLRANDGTILFWIGVNLDIDDAKRARDAVRKSEKELRDAIDTISATVWSALPDGSNAYVNKHFVEYSGRSPEQTAGSGWKAVIHPDDLGRHAAKWMEAVATGEPHENEVRFRRSDGQYRWHLDRGVPLRDEDGNIVKWYGVVTDIEDRKRAEEALAVLSRDLQESKAKLEEAQRITHVGYWEWDLLTNRVNWSEETYRIYGMQPQEGPMDVATVREKIDPRDWQRGMEEALGGGCRFNAECRVFRPTGDVRIAHFQGDVKRDASGRPYKMFGSVQDITDRKRAEEALTSMSLDVQESKTRLEEAQRIAHVGHWVWDLGNDGLTWSDETYRIFGLRPQERPMDIQAFQEMIHPEDRELLFRATREARGGEHPDVEYRIVRPSGEVRIVHSQGNVMRDVSGQPRQRFGTVQDITDRKRAEETQRRSQLYLSEGQRLARMGSWAFNPSGFFEHWSQELFEIYGLDPHKGAPTLEQYLATVHPQDRDFMANTITRMHAERSSCDVTKRIVRPDGVQRYIRCVGIPVVEDEVLKGFLGTAMDVTEQELLTQELERRQAYLVEAQRLTHTGSWAWNVASGRIFWSEEIFRIYEFDPVKVEPAWPLIFDRVHPDDRASLEQRRRMESTQTKWAESEGDFRIVVPGGRIKHLHSIAHPIMDDSGQISEVIGTVMDVTERKRVEDSLRRSERHLAEAQRLTHTGSWDWRLADRKTAHLSEEWYRIYGFDPAEGAPSWEEYLERVHPEDRLTWKAVIERAIVEKADYDQEFRILLPNGMVKWIHTVGHPVLSDAGELEQFVGSSTDITERKSAEQEREKLRQVEAELAHIDRVSTLGEMAASLAHEIKQPIAAAITSANSCIEWLAHEPPNLDRARAAAARIDKYGNRAAEIIDRIRSFYKKSPPQREFVDVNGIINEMLTLLNGEACRLSVAMRADLSLELPEIMVDRVQLQQVFMNLMLNAIEAMKDSGGELTVKSEQQDGQLQFSVSDTGVGLPSEKTDQIFSAFFTTKPQGSGMGLAISRSIVESHGGQLWASANSGRGATFHFTLPNEVQ
jgi:PAS domain S-box-containing protein